MASPSFNTGLVNAAFFPSREPNLTLLINSRNAGSLCAFVKRIFNPMFGKCHSTDTASVTSRAVERVLYRVLVDRGASEINRGTFVYRSGSFPMCF